MFKIISRLLVRQFKSNNIESIQIKGKKIAVVWAHCLGDAVIIIPFLRILRNFGGAKEIILITNNITEAVVRNQDVTDAIYVFSGNNKLLGVKEMIRHPVSTIKMILCCRKKNFDIVIEPFCILSNSLFSYMISKNVLLGPNRGRYDNLYTTKFQWKYKHISDNLKECLLYFGIKCNYRNYIYLKILNTYEDFANKWLDSNNINDSRIIGIHPGAREIVRCWIGYSTLISLILNKYPKFNILVFYSESDLNSIKNILLKYRNIKTNNRVYFVKESLWHYIALLSKCSYVVTNDSGCGHLSAALGVPLSVIYGKGDFNFIAPKGRNIINILSKPFSCRNNCNSCKSLSVPKCLSSITPSEVLNSININE